MKSRIQDRLKSERFSFAIHDISGPDMLVKQK